MGLFIVKNINNQVYLSVPAQKCAWSLGAEGGLQKKAIRQEDGSECFSSMHIRP